MRHQNVLDPAQTALAIIDMQEAFRGKISDFAEVSAHVALIAHAARLLSIPVIVTEQYPRGLGHTVGEITAVLPDGYETVEKTTFSACGAQDFVMRLDVAGARHVLICGIEAHVCVNQTTHDLLALGYTVHLLTDCITARAAHNLQLGLGKMQQSGALFSSTEMALFELMRDAQHEQFKSIQKLIK